MTRMSCRRLLAVVALAAALAPVLLTAQQPTPPSRPRIGLCLAGGGARGGAHVGVLKVLEELRIPADYVAGTSIGSIVGGLYASGYSPDQLEGVIQDIDWVSVLDDTPPRDQIEFRRKAEDYLPYWGLEMGFRGGKLRLPSGLIAGQKLDFLLRDLTLHSAGITEFDDLPIPFRAVAADLSDGSMVVLDHGTLADALRASMAIPGAFTPHEIDGRLLVDGGMVRNLPCDVVRGMGADVVIAVDVGTPVGELTDDPSFLGVVSRTLDLATKVNVAISRGQFTDRDVLMTPDLRDVATASFTKMQDAVRYGEEVARANLDRLRRFSVPEEEFNAWRDSHRAGMDAPPPVVGRVLVVSQGRVDVRRMEPRVHTEPNEPLDVDVLQDDLTRIYRLGEFESVGFRLERPEGAATADLVVSAREKSWGPDYLRVGLSLVDHFDGNSTYNAWLYHRRAGVNALGAEWRNQIILGNHLGVDSEFYQPLTFDGRYFVAPRFMLDVDKFKTFTAAGEGVTADLHRVEARLDVGRNFSVSGELRLGAYFGRVNGRTVDVAEPVEVRDRQGGWRASLAFDRLDDAVFPRSGWRAFTRVRLSRGALGADHPYDQASALLSGVVSTGRTTWLSQVEGGTSFKSDLPVYDRFSLGGFTRLSGLEPNRLQGDEYFLSRVGAYYRVGTIGAPLGGNIYAGILGEAGGTWLNQETPALEGFRFGGSAFLGIETLLGPVYLGYGLTDGGSDAVYFYLGRIL